MRQKLLLGVNHHLKLGFDDIIEVSENNQIFRLNTDDSSPTYLPIRITQNQIIEVF